MRKLLLTAMVLAAGFANAQYYTLSFINAGENPGGVNTEVEEPYAYLTGTAGYTGYSQIIAPMQTGWSAQQTLPFAFNFNGADYTTYYAAAAGVVTFASSVGTAPSDANTDLPSAEIPDNSICAWGLNLSGANDAVLNKTFGTAPNRQHWIMWTSASAPELGTGNRYCYWSIVLEESTNKVYVVDLRTFSDNGQNVSLTVGLQFDASTFIDINTSPNTSSATTTTAGSGHDPVDNTYYAFIPGVQPAVDLHLTKVNITRYVTPGNPGTISGTVRNLGANAVTSFDVIWTDGTNIFTSTVTGNVPSGGYKTFTHGTGIDLNAGETIDITVTADIAGDADLTNNSLSGVSSGAAFIPDRVVVGEEGTGTWCGWCPRGHVYMEYMEEEYADTWIGIAVHNSDPMTINEYDTWMGGMISGYPSGLVDRDPVEADPTEFEGVYQNKVDDFGVAGITVEAYMNLDREVTVDISAHFAISTSANDDFRLAAIVVEDNVTGTSGDWDQVNYYSFESNDLPLEGAGHDWQEEPNPVPAEDMVYMDVARQLLGGVEGDAGSVPATVAAEDIVTYSYDFDMDEDYNVENVTIAAILIDNNTGEIMNAGEAVVAYEIEEDGETLLVMDGDTFELWEGEWVPQGTAGIEKDAIFVYPNPAKSFVTISGVSGITNISVYDMRGELVTTTSITGNTLDVQSLTQGAYHMQIENNGNVANEMIVILQ